MKKHLTFILASCILAAGIPALAQDASDRNPSSSNPSSSNQSADTTEAANMKRVLKEAASFYMKNDFVKALYMYKAAEAMAPESAECHKGEGMSLLAMGRKREAMAAYKEATKLDPLDQESLAEALRLEADLDNSETHEGLALGGPRWGAVYLASGNFDQLKAKAKQDYGADLQSPAMSLFGWQFEWRFLTTDSGWTALSEFIPLIAGLDQGLAMPSITWLMGIRSFNGLEVGAGPNFAIDGVAYVVGIGYTVNAGQLNIPLDLAYSMGKDADRVSVSIGFNL